MAIHFGADPVDEAIRGALAQLERGTRPRETRSVDLKEEAGRRDGSGLVGPGSPDNERAAEQLAGEAACMANTPGGGALIVGVDDSGALVGAALDSEWLRYRLYQKLNRQLTVSITEATVRKVRLLIVRCPEAVEPIRWHDRIRWRLDDHCVEIDAATWHAARQLHMRFDWSAQPSTIPMSDVRPAAVEVARDFLRVAVDPEKQELARVDAATLLRRLNAVTGTDMLTNAAVLVFVGRPSACLDYIRREASGGDSTARVRRTGRSVLEDLSEVFTTARAYNPVQHVDVGLVIGQSRQLPERAVREAVVNGLAHREWSIEAPTLVEHIGATLRVTSPGGFFGGVSEHNIITHPSDSRNTALTELLAAIGVAEREGIGVDRMVGEMLRPGYQEPEIREIAGPYVSTSLVAGTTDTAWMTWLGDVGAEDLRWDLRLLMSLRRLVRHGWFDVPTLAPYLQLPDNEVVDAINHLVETEGPLGAVIQQVDGVPADAPWPAYRLADAGRERLRELDTALQRHRPAPSRERLALSYARGRGRISSTELASLAGTAAQNMSGVLKQLEVEGLLEPSRPNRRGAGLFYRPVLT